MKKRKILLIDDEKDLRENLAQQFANYEEFEISEAVNATQAFDMIKQNRFDLLILDVGLPDMDGRDALKIMRREGLNSPVILLTGHADESDEISGLEAGANDYVTKPFRFSVLLARIRAALRQFDQSEDVVFSVGPYSFQPAAKLLLTKDNKKIRLTDKESAILKYLYRAGDKIISRDELLKEVWGYNKQVTTHTLETHIYRLRQKIEQDPANVRLLITQEGGYRLVP